MSTSTLFHKNLVFLPPVAKRSRFVVSQLRLNRLRKRHPVLLTVRANPDNNISQLRRLSLRFPILCVEIRLPCPNLLKSLGNLRVYQSHMSLGTSPQETLLPISLKRSPRNALKCQTVLWITHPSTSFLVIILRVGEEFD